MTLDRGCRRWAWSIKNRPAVEVAGITRRGASIKTSIYGALEVN